MRNRSTDLEKQQRLLYRFAREYYITPNTGFNLTDITILVSFLYY